MPHEAQGNQRAVADEGKSFDTARIGRVTEGSRLGLSRLYLLLLVQRH